LQLTRRALVLIVICASLATVSGTIWAAWAASSHNWPFCANLIGSYLWNAYPTVENLTKASDVIVTGSVQTVGPSFESQNTLFTRIVLNVSQALKDAHSAGILEFRTLGGTVGCYTSITNDVSFARGNDVLLCLSLVTSPVAYLRVLAGFQGAFYVTNGTAYNPRRGNIPLNDLITEIRSHL